MIRPGTVVFILVSGVISAALFYVLWPNEERIVRGRLGDVASIVSVPANETDLARMSRLAQLREYLSPDVKIRDGAHEAVTRDMVIGTLVQWRRSPAPVKVEFVDVQVTLDRTRPERATAYLTARVTERDTVDAREADVRLARVDGKWVVMAAETKQTLTR